VSLSLPVKAIKEVSMSAWQGKANRLSLNHVDWEILNHVAAACASASMRLPDALSDVEDKYQPEERAVNSDSSCAVYMDASSKLRGGASARRVIYERRSASSLDGMTEMSLADFYVMLELTIPRRAGKIGARPPWDTMLWPTHNHLCILVHRVAGAVPGLYVLVRDPEKLNELRSCMRAEFIWSRPPGCPPQLPLYFLQAGDCQRMARLINCGQPIAADGCFSLSMVAEFEHTLCTLGARHYRRLFWEAGLIGQVLYLEAEALGLGSSGLGCFFDDAVHDVFGFSGWRYQALYGFTVGGRVKDERLAMLPAYSRERRERNDCGSWLR
jgi:hypothetical protein